MEPPKGARRLCRFQATRCCLERTTPLRMQRLFTMFPAGTPGLALVFLRLSVALTLLFACHNAPQGAAVWGYVAAALLSLPLSAGFLTPLAAVIALLVHALIWTRVGVGDMSLAGITLFNALALAMLGPGAYSVDAYRFGRRVVIVAR
jgi:hypothetical protein